MAASDPVAGSKYFAPVQRDHSLLSRSFLGLLVTQLLGATNDNILRWLVIGVGKQYVDPSRVGMILTVGTVAFVLPYLLLMLASEFGQRYCQYPVRRWKITLGSQTVPNRSAAVQ